MDAGKDAPNIELVPATAEEAPVLANLLELYTHDLSGLYPVELADDGRFGYRDLPLYWAQPDYKPLLVRVNGKLAGFVLVKRGSRITSDHETWDMAEFFVIRAWRNRGVGTEVAHMVWRCFPGRWEVRVLQSNRAALSFWEHAVRTFGGESASVVSLEWNGRPWTVFSF